jgi:hypothetical protein
VGGLVDALERLQERHAVGAVGEVLPRPAGLRHIHDRTAVDVVIAAGDGGLAIAARQPIAGLEEGLIAELGEPSGLIGAVEAELRADRHARHA